MNRHMLRKRALAMTGAVLALAVAVAGPAAAHNGDDHTTPPEPGAYASKSQAVEGNLHDIPVGPLTVANWPSGPTHAVLTGSQHVVEIGALESNANGSYDEGWVSADSSIASVTGGINGILTIELDAISSECRSDASGQTASASIAGGRISVLGYGAIDIPLNPAPNTSIGIPGVLEITLNKQEVHADGAITVTAIDIHGSDLLQTLLLSQHPLYLTLGQSTCDQVVEDYAVPAASPVGMATAGVGVLALTGTALVVLRRRRNAVAAV